MADTSRVEEDFQEELEKMKDELTKEGWLLPQLEVNMRNQINISNLNIEQHGNYPMQSSIQKLRSASNVVGEIPTLFKVKNEYNWPKKKDAILEHCVQEMDGKDNKNLVVLYDSDHSGFKDVDTDLKRLIKDKTVVEYPSKQNKQKGLQNIKNFIEKDNHILVTEAKYFNGWKASKVLFLAYYGKGVRNALLRSVKNLLCVEVGGLTTINGMKEDRRFY